MEGQHSMMDAYCIVTMEEHAGGENLRLLDMSPYYQYDLFMDLMDLLQYTQQGDCGFWGNRNIILKLVAHLSIVVEKETKDIAAFYIMIPSKDGKETNIEFFEVFHQGKGLGRALIEYESARRPSLFVETALSSSRGFWSKVGIPCHRTV